MIIINYCCDKCYKWIAVKLEDDNFECICPKCNIEMDYMGTEEIDDETNKVIKRYQEDSRKQYSTSYTPSYANIPKCPTCQSTKVKKISASAKVTNTVLWGIFGTKRFKTFHCDSCGYEW